MAAARAGRLGQAHGPDAEGALALGRTLGAGCSGVMLLAVVMFLLPKLEEEMRAHYGQGPAPDLYTYRVVRRYAHDPEAFTQGLLWLNGSLYESTGLHGRSGVREVRLGSKGGAKVVREAKSEERHFGEGLVHFRGELLQLLWRTGDGLIYEAKAGKDGYLRQTGTFRTPLGDGWGLETDGAQLLATNNGAEVFFLDPDSFEVRRHVVVTDQGRPVQMINELEYIDGELWANVYGTECIARIDPANGAVRGWVLLDGLLDRRVAAAEARAAGHQPPDVLNGIAWDAEEKRLFVTGKLWPTLFEVEVVPFSGDLKKVRQGCIPARNIFRPDHDDDL